MNPNPPHRFQSARALWAVLQERTRLHRRNPTPAEAFLWERLRSGRLNGIRFRRQHPVGEYILDFYCWKAHLAVELDGPYHDRHREHDAARDRTLNTRGIRVLRFTNAEVEASIDTVVAAIQRAIEENSLLPAKAEHR